MSRADVKFSFAVSLKLLYSKNTIQALEDEYLTMEKEIRGVHATSLPRAYLFSNTQHE